MAISTTPVSTDLTNNILGHGNPIFLTNMTRRFGMEVVNAAWQNHAAPTTTYNDPITLYAGTDGEALIRTAPDLGAAVVNRLSYRFVTVNPMDGVEGFAVFLSNIPYLLKPSEVAISVQILAGDSFSSKAGDVVAINTAIPYSDYDTQYYPINFQVLAPLTFNGAQAFEINFDRTSNFTSTAGSYPEIGDIWPVKYFGTVRPPIRGFPVAGMFMSVGERVPMPGGGERFITQGFGQGRWIYEYQLSTAIGSPERNEYEHLAVDFLDACSHGSDLIGLLPGATPESGFKLLDGLGPLYLCSLEEFRVKEIGLNLFQVTIELKESPPFMKGVERRG